jgi:acyl dehydratase
MSTETELQWNLDGLGTWTEPSQHEVTRERIIAFAEATNDEHPAHRSGDLAPPVFAVVPTMIEVLGPEVVKVVPTDLLMRGVHGQQEFRYHRPIEPGQKLSARAAVVGVTGRSTGVVVLGKAETSMDGELVVEQWMTFFVRGAQFDGSVGEPLPEHAFPEQLRGSEPAATVTHGYDADQTRRYSEAAGDPMPIHLDEDLAKSMGLPGIIVHGMCTMAFCSRAVVQEFCNDDPTRLERLGVRFAKVVQPSEKVTHSLWEAGDGHVVFETTSDNGNVVIKDGFAEIKGG